MVARRATCGRAARSAFASLCSALAVLSLKERSQAGAGTNDELKSPPNPVGRISLCAGRLDRTSTSSWHGPRARANAQCRATRCRWGAPRCTTRRCNLRPRATSSSCTPWERPTTNHLERTARRVHSSHAAMSPCTRRSCSCSASTDHTCAQCPQAHDKLRRGRKGRQPPIRIQ